MSKLNKIREANEGAGKILKNLVDYALLAQRFYINTLHLPVELFLIHSRTPPPLHQNTGVLTNNHQKRREQSTSKGDMLCPQSLVLPQRRSHRHVPVTAQRLGPTQRTATAALAKQRLGTALQQKGEKGISENRSSAITRVKYLWWSTSRNATRSFPVPLFVAPACTQHLSSRTLLRLLLYSFSNKRIFSNSYQGIC